MLSAFSGLDIGFSGLQANQKALEVTGHNVANASREEYSRQQVTFNSSTPLYLSSFNSPTGTGMMGTGSMVDNITRVTDAFIEQRILDENKAQGYWDKMEQLMHQLELIYNEPSDASLRSALDEFWGSLQDLANSEAPTEMTAAKSLVRERAESLTTLVNSIYSQFQELGGSGGYSGGVNAVDEEIKTDVDNINGWAKEIAELNEAIMHAQSADRDANDLLDRRDLLISNMSKLMNVSAKFTDEDDNKVLIGGMVIVQGVESYELRTKRDPLDGRLKIYHSAADKQVMPSGGEIKALMDFRDDVLTAHMKNLNDFVINFTEKFNEIHNNGFGVDGSTGINFFEPLPEKTEGIYKLTGNNFIKNIEAPLDGIFSTSDPENFERRVRRESSSAVTATDSTFLDVTKKFSDDDFVNPLDTGSRIKISIDNNKDGKFDGSEVWYSDKLINYKSIQDFMNKVNYNNTVLDGITLVYDETNDKFTFINVDGNKKIEIDDIDENNNSVTNGFFNAANLITSSTKEISFNNITDREYLSTIDYTAANESELGSINTASLQNGDICLVEKDNYDLRTRFQWNATNNNWERMKSDRLAINGYNINYDTTIDTIDDIVNRINNSNCGVLADVDPTGRLTLTATKSSDFTIKSLEDTGNLLSTLGLLSPGEEYFGDITDERNIIAKKVMRTPEEDASYSFAVSEDIKLDLNKIANHGGKDTNNDGFFEEMNGPGDNSNALKLADLKNAAIMENGTTRFNDFFNSMISDLAVNAQVAKSNAENKEMLVTNLKETRSSISGVSMDEELTNMLKFQQAYSAAARYIGVYQKIIDTLLALIR